MIAAQMTARLQLTDIMPAAKMKKIMFCKRHQLKRLLRRKSIAERKKAIYKCGPREIMWIVNEIGKEMEKWNEEEEYILKGVRQAGMLAYRPDFEKKCLVRATGDWCDKHPLGVGGKIEPDWIEQRYNFLDKDGKPIPPDWSKQSNAQKLEDQLEVDYCVRYEQGNELFVSVVEQEVFDENAKLLQKHPKIREKINKLELAKVTPQGSALALVQKDGEGSLEGSRAKVKHLLQKLTQEERDAYQHKAKMLGYSGRHLARLVFMRGHLKGNKGKGSRPGASKFVTSVQKHMLKKKQLSIKNAKDRADNKEKQKEKDKKEKDEAPTDKPPLPPPEEKQGPLHKQSVRLCEENVPSRFFGKRGFVTEHRNGYVTVEIYNSMCEKAREIPESSVVADGGENTKPLEKKSLQKLSNQQIDVINGVVVDLAPLKKHPQQWLTQSQIRMGMERLQFQYASSPTEELVSEGNRVKWIDPALISTRFAVADQPEFEDSIVDQLREANRSCRKLLLPILGSSHWVLLVLEKAAEKQDALAEPWILTIRYYDTNQAEMQSLRNKAQQLLTDIVGKALPEHQLPKRRNYWTQPSGSGVCGVALLHYAEEEVRHSRGEGLGISPIDCKGLSGLLDAFHKKLERRKAQKALDEKPKAELIYCSPLEKLQAEHEAAKEAALADEEKQKTKALDKPIEYRCARCRWSKGGTGCDTRGCNPHKYLAKMQKFLDEKKCDWDALEKLQTQAVIDVEAEKAEGGGAFSNSR